MKSSTIRRSTLSRETMEVIENLAKEQEQQDSTEEYVRPDAIEPMETEKTNNKAQEIDLLWQNFKTTQFNTNSPVAYVLMGFAAGLLTAAILGFAGMYVLKSRGMVISMPQAAEEQTIEQQTGTDEQLEAKVNVPSEDNNSETNVQSENTTAQNSAAEGENAAIDTSKMKKYIVKSGDTGESIIKKHYGAYSPERAEQIMKANNLKSLDRINIDQELLIPAE